MSLTTRPGGSLTLVKTEPVETLTRISVRAQPIHKEVPESVANAGSLKPTAPWGSGMDRIRVRVAGSISLMICCVPAIGVP